MRKLFIFLTVGLLLLSNSLFSQIIKFRWYSSDNNDETHRVKKVNNRSELMNKYSILVRQAAAEAQAESTSKQWQIIGWIFLVFVLLGMMSKC